MEALSSPSPSPGPPTGDFHTHDGQPRIRRKPPPPANDQFEVESRKSSPFLLPEREERYPTPDPSDPFAPLWVLRQRTSSTPLCGSDDSRDTLDTLPLWPHNSDTNKSHTPRNDGAVHNNTRSSTPIIFSKSKFKGDASKTRSTGFRTCSPKPLASFTPCSQQYAFPKAGRPDTPHIFSSHGPTPLRSGISVVRIQSEDEGGSESDVSKSSSASELIFRPVFDESFERPNAKRPDSSGSSGFRESYPAPGVRLDDTARLYAGTKVESKIGVPSAPSLGPQSSARDPTRVRFAQLRSLWKPLYMSRRKRSLSVGLPSPVPVASERLPPNPIGTNVQSAAKTALVLPSNHPHFQQPRQRNVTTPAPILEDNVTLIEGYTDRNDAPTTSPCVIKNNGAATVSRRYGAHRHLHQHRSSSMGAAAASCAAGAAAHVGRIPPKSDQERIIDPESGRRIASTAPAFSLPPDTSPVSKNTPTVATLISGHDTNLVRNSFLSDTTDLAHHDGPEKLMYSSHSSIIADTRPRAKTDSRSDPLGPRIKELDEEGRQWLTQDSPLPPPVLPSRKVEASMQLAPATMAPHTNHPSVTFAPPSSPEPSSPRRSMKASILATVFATTASRAVVTKTTAAVPTMETVTESVRGVTGPPPRRKRSKFSSLSSVSSTSSTSMVFANPDYIIPPKPMHMHKISSPEPSPSFDHSMSPETFVSPRPAPAPPGPIPFRALASPKSTKSPEPIVVELRSKDEVNGSLVGINPTCDQKDVSSGALKEDVCETDDRRGARQGTLNAARLTVPDDKVVPGEWAIPSTTQISRAALLPVQGEDGRSVQFGSLFTAHRTIVVFIRHFWCPLCQDYIASLRAIVKPDMLVRPKSTTHGKGHPQQRQKDETPAALRRSVDGWVDGGPRETKEQQLVGFVVIGNGAHAMIKKYRQIFGLPFAVYTDPELEVYHALGMGRDGDDGHRHLPASPTISQRHRRASLSSIACEPSPARLSHVDKQEKKDEGYVKHGLVGGIAMVIVRALKVGMPVWEKGGDIAQLGGEFIFGPGLTCSFAHRMQTTKDHAPIENVLEAAGIDVHADIQPPKRTESMHQVSNSMYVNGNARRHNSLHESTGANYKRATLIRRGDERPSSTYSTGHMSREEEETWMAERQLQLDALHDRKLARRGILNRASSAPELADQPRKDRINVVKGEIVLEPVGEMSEDLMEDGEDNDTDRRHSVDTAGGDADDEDDNDTLADDPQNQNDMLIDEIHERLRSMTNLNDPYPADHDGEETDDVRHSDFMLSDTEGTLSSKEDHEWPIPPSHTPSLREAAVL